MTATKLMRSSEIEKKKPGANSIITGATNTKAAILNKSLSANVGLPSRNTEALSTSVMGTSRMLMSCQNS